jgi:hypothetical protein
MILNDIGQVFLNGATAEDSIVKQLFRDDLIGVTQAGNELYIRNSFLICETDTMVQDQSVPIEHTFQGFAKKIKAQVEERNSKTFHELGKIQYGISQVMGYYDKIIVVGAKGCRSEIIVKETD